MIVWIFKEEWINHRDSGSNTRIYATKEKAQEAFETAAKECLSEYTAEQMESEYSVEKNDRFFELYREDNYFEDHYSVSIESYPIIE